MHTGVLHFAAKHTANKSLSECGHELFPIWKRYISILHLKAISLNGSQQNGDLWNSGTRVCTRLFSIVIGQDASAQHCHQSKIYYHLIPSLTIWITAHKGYNANDIIFWFIYCSRSCSQNNTFFIYSPSQYTSRLANQWSAESFQPRLLALTLSQRKPIASLVELRPVNSELQSVIGLGHIQ